MGEKEGMTEIKEQQQQQPSWDRTPSKGNVNRLFRNK